MSERETEKWLQDYVNSQLREFNDRWVETNEKLTQARIEVNNAIKAKAKYEAIIFILKTIQKNIIHYPQTDEAKETIEASKQ